MKGAKLTFGKRRIVKSITLFVIVAVLLPILSLFISENAYAATGDEVRAAKKIISVVYDDSGSMVGERWAYANYSTQALIALMNEQDELYVTFMRDPEVSQPVSLSSLQNSVNMIRDLSETGNTPEKALDTAMARLDSIQEDDPATQFWLIVMTDGEIYDYPSNSIEIDIQGKLNSYKNKVMSNSSGLNVVYLGMVGAANVNGDDSNHLYSYMPNDDYGIVSTMQGISNLVSSRIAADDVTRIDSHTIQVTSKLPLYNISVLSQRSSASVKSAKTQEENLNVQRNISLDATSLHHGADIPSLYGNAAVINRRNGDEQLVIPAGTYTIVFSDEVDISDITVQLEPAIDFLPQVTRDGVSVTDTSNLNYEDIISVKLVPVIPGTTEIIPDDALPEGMSWDVKYLVDGNEIASSLTNELNDITLDEGYNTIRGEITIPGFVPYKREFGFEIINEIIEIDYNLGLIVEEPDIYVPSEDMPDDYEIQGVTYDRFFVWFRSAFTRKLKLDSSNTVRFVITNDGSPLSAKEIESLGITLSLEPDNIDYIESESKGLFDWLGNKYASCELIKNNDGSYSLIPLFPSHFPFFTFLIKAGSYSGHVKLLSPVDDVVEATGTFRVVPNVIENWIPFIMLLILIIVLYLFFCLFVKRKFRRQEFCYEYWVLSDDNRHGNKKDNKTYSETLTNSELFWPPRKACHQEISLLGLDVFADSDGDVYISGKSISENCKKYGVSDNDPKYLASLIRNLDEVKNGEKVENKLVSQAPLYLLTNSRTVLKIWIED